ncbi:hypothetical protein ACFVYR_17840 [Streptomyces sp. NPDC058284]|uniref:hypothetical protein n=1 Tax=unclassified Streptomyces TaxID=2593676 RepID=UPI0036581711
MADEQHKWLDRDAAERLLRGEPLEDVDPHARAQADRLAAALAALAAQNRFAETGGGGEDGNGDRSGTERRSASGEGSHPENRTGTGTGPGLDADAGPGPALPDIGADGLTGPAPAALPGELPGEAAALAAFREARAGLPQSGGGRSRTAPYATAAHEAAASETVRLGRAGSRPAPSRWGRPVRFGIAAALAGCMIGGVAVAAGTGVLPSPFGTHSDPGPTVSASADTAGSEEPQAPPSDDAGEPSEELSPDEGATPGDGATREPASTASPEAGADGEGESDAGDDPTDPPEQPGGDKPAHRDEARNWYRKAVAACRAYRSGELQGGKRRRLEEIAKGPARVEAFCGRVLGGSGGGGQQGGGHQGGGGHQNGGGNGHGGGHGDGGGDGGGKGSGGDDDGGSGGGTGGVPGPPMSSPAAPGATPTASYSALPHLP